MNDIVPKQMSWFPPVLFAAMAGGMAWGIRGQYGHETGAAIAGLLVSTTLVFLLAAKLPLRDTIRAVAWGTVAMGFGGSMTYGQTVGLTHDPDLVGNWEALRWGMLGLSIKGALWIGFAGAFLGIGLGGKRYRFIELFILMWALLGAYALGIIEFNSPFNPAKQFLPSIYFSADWYWKPGQAIKPRFECWGGMFFAFVVLLVYTGFYRKDRLALWMGLWGALGGALGFPLGQSLQAFHAWNPETFRQGIWAWLDPNMNWWNMMETTFGAIAGAALGLGLWLNRRRIQAPEEPGGKDLPPAAEWGLLAVHLALLVAVEFASIGWVDRIYDLGLMMGLIPIAAIAGGRWWPSLILFSITLIPIAGKTVKNLVYDSAAVQPALGWLLYLALPLLLSIGMAVWLMRRIGADGPAADVLRIALLFNAWMYFLLNYAFFRFPFPWAAWTGRTPNGIIFTVCVLGLTFAALFFHRKTDG